jgi:hypothetical protein
MRNIYLKSLQNLGGPSNMSISQLLTSCYPEKTWKSDNIKLKKTQFLLKKALLKLFGNEGTFSDLILIFNVNSCFGES